MRSSISAPLSSLSPVTLPASSLSFRTPRVYNFVLVGGVTVVLTTRQPRTEIFALLDCVVLMRDGQRGRARRAPQATD